MTASIFGASKPVVRTPKLPVIALAEHPLVCSSKAKLDAFSFVGQNMIVCLLCSIPRTRACEATTDVLFALSPSSRRISAGSSKSSDTARDCFGVSSISTPLGSE